jgi:hypothetical protein
LILAHPARSFFGRAGRAGVNSRRGAFPSMSVQRRAAVPAAHGSRRRSTPSKERARCAVTSHAVPPGTAALATVGRAAVRRCARSPSEMLGGPRLRRGREVEEGRRGRGTFWQVPSRTAIPQTNPKTGCLACTRAAGESRYTDGLVTLQPKRSTTQPPRSSDCGPCAGPGLPETGLQMAALAWTDLLMHRAQDSGSPRVRMEASDESLPARLSGRQVGLTWRLS